jgi:hypothetical protein
MRYVLIGQKGSDQVLVVDTQSMTVTPLDSASVIPSSVQEMLDQGGSLVDGIDIAVAANQREDGSSIWFFQGK